MLRRIAVGVGRSGDRAALVWAAEEADRAAARLVIVHVCPPESPLARLSGAPWMPSTGLCEPALAGAVGAARARLGGPRVALQIRTGGPAAALVDASVGVDVLVVGAGRTGRTARRVIRGARCPVVVVRREAPAPGAPFAGHVVVGVDGSAAARAACEFAFDYADEHGVPLAAAHVSAHSDDDYFYDESTLSTHFTTEPAVLELLAAEVEPWSLKYPQVIVRRAVLCGTVVDGLVRAAAGARLLVIGDKRRGAVSRARTGDVPFAVVRRADCPTALVPWLNPGGDSL
jgi:nucleotide-binding universal stress UspA family protein